MKTMTGLQDEGSRGVALDGFNSDKHLADELNIEPSVEPLQH